MPEYRYAREFDTVYPNQLDENEHTLVATLGTVYDWPEAPDDRWIPVEPASFTVLPAVPAGLPPATPELD